MGRISTKVTGIPARATCQAASVPASPAPRTVTDCPWDNKTDSAFSYELTIRISAPLNTNTETDAQKLTQ